MAWRKFKFYIMGFFKWFNFIFRKSFWKIFNMPSFVKIILTCFIIFNLWIVFRINEFSQLIVFIVEFYSNINRLFLLENLLILIILIIGVISQKFDNFDQIKRFSQNISLYVILPFFMIIILAGLGMNAGTSEKFIYFEF